MLRDFFSNDKETPLDGQIDAVLKEMQKEGVRSEEYPKLMRFLEQLYEMKTRDRQAPVSRDTIALIGGALLQTLLTVAYEQKHVITSKAFPKIIELKR